MIAASAETVETLETSLIILREPLLSEEFGSSG
jgi:hypothetical protein